MSDPVKVLVMAPHLGDDLSWVASVDPRVEVLDGNAVFLAELAEQGVVRRGARVAVPADAPSPPRREELLGEAEVALLGFPIPPRLVDRAPRLKWAQQTQAGVSNLFGSDLWASSVLLTSSRGSVGTTAIAEYAIAGVMFFARGIEVAARAAPGRFSPRSEYRLRTLGASTLGIVGLGGIGGEVARLGRALGLRVVATRRSVTEPQHDREGVDLLLPAAQLLDMAAMSDYLVICSQLTDETRGMIDSRVLATLPEGAVLINIARGEEVDEDALIAAIRSGHLRGAVLDVYDGELAGGPPRPELLETPAIVLTPHISAGGDAGHGGPVKALFADNLRRYLAGEPLRNVVDRERGY